MPDPRALKVGDRLRFVAIPEEWSDPKFSVPDEDRAFMHVLIGRRTPRLVYEIDEYGMPWVQARVWIDGRREYHIWAISELTGWRLVEPRNKSRT